jgi:hypothetical protein
MRKPALQKTILGETNERGAAPQKCSACSFVAAASRFTPSRCQAVGAENERINCTKKIKRPEKIFKKKHGARSTGSALAAAHDMPQQKEAGPSVHLPLIFCVRY